MQVTHWSSCVMAAEGTGQGTHTSRPPSIPESWRNCELSKPVALRYSPIVLDKSRG